MRNLKSSLAKLQEFFAGQVVFVGV